MSAIPAVNEVDEAEPQTECWCCGTANPPSNLLRLNSHPEVAVCLSCADYLALRAGERRDKLRPTLSGRSRNVLRTARSAVVDHGWHRLPVIGPILRWIGRFTP
jgi:hypothetical protein